MDCYWRVAAAVLLVVVLVWAFVFAPYAKITVKMKTVASNISENVTLVTDEKKKNNANRKIPCSNKLNTKMNLRLNLKRLAKLTKAKKPKAQ